MAVIKMPVSKLPKAKRDRDSKQNRDKGKAQPTEWDVCAICDEGGSLICCDGGCLRSFHPTRKSGKESKCTTLGLTEEELQTLESNDEKYMCKNCKSKQHQCFACGLLGSSDLTSGTEVFQCKDKQCARFYHPKCVAEVLYPDSKSRALRFGNDVASGLEFHCPMHRCSLCKEAENRDDKDMRLAVCGRCPTAYHQKCLPRGISFKENKEKGIYKRAWDDVLPHQDFIYCMKHKMDKDLRTPRRDHIVFPDTRNPCAAKRPRCQETQKEEEMIDRPLPSQSPQKTKAGCDRVKPIDSFAPRHLFPRPHPGSCGWLDD